MQNKTNQGQKAESGVSCLKQGSEMRSFCLKQGSGFAGLGFTPLPKLPLSAPLPRALRYILLKEKLFGVLMF